MKKRSASPPPAPQEFAAVASEPTVAAVVRTQTGLAWSRARRLCMEGRVVLNGVRCVDPAARVPAGAVVAVDFAAPKLRAGPLPADAIVYFDRDLVVIDKPAGMLAVADVPGNKETALDYTRTLLRRVDRQGVDARLSVVHRIDRDTSGLMVFARTPRAKDVLAAQFRDHSIDRVYHAIACGRVAPQRIESLLVLDRGDGLRGSYGLFRRTKTPPPDSAKRAVTHVAVVEHLEGATRVECRLETGRQHQIRIHLAELGHPILGETVYIRDYAGPAIAAPRLMLHAQALAFLHPRSGERMAFEREPPDDFRQQVAALRGPSR
jgi:23S rRNA pseudouridine1911/1915/1917 synthase